MTKISPIIVALDVPGIAEAQSLAHTLDGFVGAFKVGLELFNAAGPSIFDRVRESAPGARIFYDAKFHDIPNTVAGAVRAAARHGLWMVNVHASGGRTMMRAAVDAAKSIDENLLVVAVTVLTSLDDQVLSEQLGIGRTASAQAVALARLAQEAGCDGVVASPHEVSAIKGECGPGFLLVTPGVRPAGSDAADQKRIMTPGDAIRAGSDYLVIGRPVTAAASPRDAAQAILEEIGRPVPGT